MRGKQWLAWRGTSALKVWRAWLGSYCSLLLVAALDRFVAGDYGVPMLIGSFGASAVLLFAAPESPLSRPRNLLGGHGPYRCDWRRAYTTTGLLVCCGPLPGRCRSHAGDGMVAGHGKAGQEHGHFGQYGLPAASFPQKDSRSRHRVLMPSRCGCAAADSRAHGTAWPRQGDGLHEIRQTTVVR